MIGKEAPEGSGYARLVGLLVGLLVSLQERARFQHDMEFVRERSKDGTTSDGGSPRQHDDGKKLAVGMVMCQVTLLTIAHDILHSECMASTITIDAAASSQSCERVREPTPPHRPKGMMLMAVLAQHELR